MRLGKDEKVRAVHPSLYVSAGGVDSRMDPDERMQDVSPKFARICAYLDACEELRQKVRYQKAFRIDEHGCRVLLDVPVNSETDRLAGYISQPPEEHVDPLARRGISDAIPWRAWYEAGTVTLYRGVHWYGNAKDFVKRARINARNSGYSVEPEEVSDGIVRLTFKPTNN